MDGSNPMIPNPTPKTSSGVKILLNSVIFGVFQVYVVRRGVGIPCLYPRLANSASSWLSSNFSARRRRCWGESCDMGVKEKGGDGLFKRDW